MRDMFPGHFSRASFEQKELWDNSIFVFDANVLLNQYRYSDETRSQFVRILERLQDRIWIPYRVAEEYLKRRLEVIDQQEKKYDAAINDVERLCKDLDNNRQHPFVSESSMKKFNAAVSGLIGELNKNKEINSRRIFGDEIKDKLNLLFAGRVGGDFNRGDMEGIISEGVARYSERIPPGYSDLKKAAGGESFEERCRPYGDLIIWKQIINKAKLDNVSVIFVTDDGKEDWWLRFKGKTISPRPELIKEFLDETGMGFYMYQPEQFLSLAGKQLEQETSQEILQEIRDVRDKTRVSSEALAEYRNTINSFSGDEVGSDLLEEYLILQRGVEKYQKLIESAGSEIAFLSSAENELKESVMSMQSMGELSGGGWGVDGHSNKYRQAVKELEQIGLRRAFLEEHCSVLSDRINKQTVTLNERRRLLL